MREFMNKALYLNKPERFHTLHQQAALFYEAKLENARGEERERFMLERVYHRLLADEVSGIQLFQQTAEELVHYRFFVRLRALLKDMETYKLELHEETSLLWLKYYNARLALLEEKWEEAEYLYEEIEKARPEPKLYAYTLCDHGEILSMLEWRKKEGSPQKAVELIQRAFGLMVPDRKLISGHKSLSIVYEFQGQMELAEHHLLEMLQFYQQQEDAIGAADVCFDLRWHYMLRGNWKRMLEVHKIGLENMAPYLDISPALKEKALRVNWGHIWVGRYNEFVNNFRIIVEEVLPQLADSNRKSHDLCFLAYGEGMRKTFDEAQGHFNEAFALLREQGLENRKDFQGPYRGFWGAIYTKQGSLDKAEQYLREALAIKQEVQDALGIPELLIWLGEIYEIRKIWEKAENFYRQCMEDYRVGRPYFDCTALTGLVRVTYSLSQFDRIPSLFNQAETLAQQYEYNDHLASLYLTQGHLVWEDQYIDEKQRFDTALRFYQRALIHALRYNRFLLDEVLSGKVPTTLQSLIPHCLEKGEEGLQMLRSIRDWWQRGTNDTGTPRLDTISLILEGMQLLDAELKARQLEPGTAQQTVLEQLQGF